MAHEVVLLPSALEDLRSIFIYVAEAADIQTVQAYIGRIRSACFGLANFPKRGTPRDDLKKGLRTISFERRAVIAFVVRRKEVQIVRVLHGGRDLGRAF